MPTDRITLAEWQAMDSNQLRAHIARGVLPPIMGGALEEGESAEAAGGETPPTGTTQNPETPPADEAPKNTDGLKKALDEERQRVKDLQKQVKELVPKAKAHDELTAEQQTELEKAQKEAADAQDALAATTSQIQSSNLQVALTDAKYGLASAQAAATLLQAEGIEFGDDNRPVNLDDAVKALVEANPFLLGEKPKPKAPDTNNREGAQAERKVDLSPEEIEAAEKAGKTPEEWQALKGVKNIDDFMALQAAKKST